MAIKKSSNCKKCADFMTASWNGYWICSACRKKAKQKSKEEAQSYWDKMLAAYGLKRPKKKYPFCITINPPQLVVSGLESFKTLNLKEN